MTYKKLMQTLGYGARTQAAEAGIIEYTNASRVVGNMLKKMNGINAALANDGHPHKFVVTKAAEPIEGLTPMEQLCEDKAAERNRVAVVLAELSTLDKVCRVNGFYLAFV